MGFKNRFLGDRRVKPDRPQKNKGYQGFLAAISVALVIPIRFYGALQTRTAAIHFSRAFYFSVTNQGRSASVQTARSRGERSATPQAARSKSWEDKPA
jgi:hypothetical protein